MSFSHLNTQDNRNHLEFFTFKDEFQKKLLIRHSLQQIIDEYVARKRELKDI
jgi:hypothetical protein